MQPWDVPFGIRYCPTPLSNGHPSLCVLRGWSLFEVQCLAIVDFLPCLTVKWTSSYEDRVRMVADLMGFKRISSHSLDNEHPSLC